MMNVVHRDVDTVGSGSSEDGRLECAVLVKEFSEQYHVEYRLSAVIQHQRQRACLKRLPDELGPVIHAPTATAAQVTQ